MSGLIAIVSRGGARTDASTARRMLRALASRGGDRSEIARDGAVTMGVARHEWECCDGMSGATLTLVDDDLIVAADATLYYLDELQRALEATGVRIGGRDSSHLIAAAYRAWGEECAHHLEGDFAFVVWDRAKHRAVAARDFGGKRPLYYAPLGDVCIIASTLSAILAHPLCPAELNLEAVAADAAGLLAAQRDTPYRAIATLPSAHTLDWNDGRLRLARHWAPPPVREGRGPSFDDAAEELRELLTRSVAERLDRGRDTAVWMSGGWDSTAVFASAHRARCAAASAPRVHPVSISFPSGDPGREDELIDAVATHYGSTPRWLDIGDVRLVDTSLDRSAMREAPFGHVFELGQRALAKRTRESGARVALDGSGGDQLFQVSELYLADLLRTGRWRSLAREWKLKGLAGSGFRNFFRCAIQPLLPAPALRAAAWMRGGRPLLSHLERALPSWIDPGYARTHRLIEREASHTPSRTTRDRAAYETHWYLTHEFFPRVFGMSYAFGLEEGIELRSPLFDRRIIELAVTRPREERSSGAETKRLLRHAMRGLLPDHVLAPRRSRTGTTGRYFAHAMRVTHAAELSAILYAPLSLEAAGIVNAAELRRRWSEYLRDGNGALGTSLFFTIQAECWLRAHAGARSSGRAAIARCGPSPELQTGPGAGEPATASALPFPRATLPMSVTHCSTEAT